LAQGETKVETFTVHVNDGTATTDQVISVTLTVTNEPPVISSHTDGAVTEDVAVDGSGKLNSTGNIHFTDVDLIDSHSVTVTAGAGALGALTASVATDTLGSSLGGAVNSSYFPYTTLFRSLAQGETKVETFTVHVNDGTATTDQ